MFSLFKKKTPVPGWANFFTSDEYSAFMEALGKHMASQNIKFTEQDGIIHLPNKDFGSENNGLLNIAQMCKQQGKDHYAAAIAHHFDTLARQASLDEEFKKIENDFSKVGEYVGVRLYYEDYAAGIGTDHVIIKKIGGDIIAMIVFDLPDAVLNVRPELLKAWNMSTEEVFNAGVANIRKKYKTQVTEEMLGDLKLWFASADHFFVANTIFEFEAKPELVGPFGSLIGLPHRHAALIYPIKNLEVVQAINTLIPVVKGMFHEGPGSLSDNLLWYCDGRYVNLPYRIEDKKLSFIPPKEFVDMIQTLPQSK